MRRHFYLLPVAILGLAGGVRAQEPQTRYLITPRQPATVNHDQLRAAVLLVSPPNGTEPDGGGLAAELDFPQYGVNAVAATLTTEQVSQLGQARYIFRIDPPMAPAGAPAGAAWPMDRFEVPTRELGCPPAVPVVYVVDTGIDAAHPDLVYPPSAPVLTLLPGLSYGMNRAVFPPSPLPPYFDPYDHGTRVASCFGGVTSGLLGPLGGAAAVKSVLIYDAPATPSTFASQAINGILGSAADHAARRALPYRKNHVSVLLFAHTTSAADGRFADLDRAVEIAWQAGMHVVLSAGNQGAAAVRVSPAGAAWGYTAGGPPVRFWYGQPPSGAVFYRAAEEFFVTGAHDTTGLWPGTNGNIPGAETVDAFAPGVGIPCASVSPPGSFTTGTGTSYSAAFAAAVTARAAGSRFWAVPAVLRQWVKAGRDLSAGWPRLRSIDPPATGGLSFVEWAEYFYPPATEPATKRTATGDPDGDGVANFLEYHGGLDPRFADDIAGPVMTAELTGGTLKVRAVLPVACHLSPTPDVAWELQRSTDLQTWTAAALTSSGPILPLQPAGDGRMWAAETNLTPVPGGREFFRLKIASTVPLP